MCPCAGMMVMCDVVCCIRGQQQQEDLQLAASRQTAGGAGGLDNDMVVMGRGCCMQCCTVVRRRLGEAVPPLLAAELHCKNFKWSQCATRICFCSCGVSTSAMHWVPDQFSFTE
jgi:hypothetical protein